MCIVCLVGLGVVEAGWPALFTSGESVRWQWTNWVPYRKTLSAGGAICSCRRRKVFTSTDELHPTICGISSARVKLKIRHIWLMVNYQIWLILIISYGVHIFNIFFLAHLYMLLATWRNSTLFLYSSCCSLLFRPLSGVVRWAGCVFIPTDINWCWRLYCVSIIGSSSVCSRDCISIVFRHCERDLCCCCLLQCGLLLLKMLLLLVVVVLLYCVEFDTLWICGILIQSFLIHSLLGKASGWDVSTTILLLFLVLLKLRSWR